MGESGSAAELGGRAVRRDCSAPADAAWDDGAMAQLAELLRGWQRGRAPYGSAAAPQPVELDVPVELRRAVNEDERPMADEPEA